MKILALDLGKFKSVACYFDSELQTTEFWTLSTDRDYVITILRKYQPELVVIEACSIAAWVHDLCSELGFRILVCNPNQEAWRWKNVKRKTDRDDALKLAKLAALGQLVPVHIPAVATREHRWLVKYRKTIVGRLNRVQNILRALYQQHGLHLPVGARCWTISNLEAMQQQSKPLNECTLDELWRGQLAQELAAYHQLQAELKLLETKLTALAAQDERIQLLETIPGVGRVTAEIIATHLDRPERFSNGRQVSSYAGLVPRRYQSGLMDRQGGITRRGSRLLRSALVECAWVMLRYNPWAAEQYVRLCHNQKNRKKKAIIALARKLLVRCWAMLRDRRSWSTTTTTTTTTTIA
jgi:transposase